MEVANETLARRFRNLFLKEPVPFSGRRELNWSAIKGAVIGLVVIAIVGLLFAPSSRPENASFQEKGALVSSAIQMPEGNPTAEAAAQLEVARGSTKVVHRSLDYLYRSYRKGHEGGSREQNTSMIVTRGGLDLKTQIPSGSRIRVRLLSKATVADQSMPIIGIVVDDFIHEGTSAVRGGSKIFGEVSFSGGDRAQVTWKAIEMPDGRERPLSAIGVSQDGQVGIAGQIHSDAVKNTLGQTLTRFVGAYYEGSIQRGAFGGNPGGKENGLNNAIAETAKDRAESLAEDMKKERRWIEVGPEIEFYAVLSSPFIFRDPGVSY